MDVLVDWEIDGHVFRAGLVTTEEERLECYKFRYRHYHKRLGQIPPHPDEIDVDFADEYSSMICAYDDKNTLIGTSRHIHCEFKTLLLNGRSGEPEVFSGRRFELPKAHPESGEQILPEQVVEGSRWVGPPFVLPDGRKVLISRLLMQATMRLCRLEGDKYIVTAMVHEQVNRLLQDGWDFVELFAREDKEPHVYHGALVRVGIMRVPREELDYYYQQLT